MMTAKMSIIKENGSAEENYELYEFKVFIDKQKVT